MEHTFYIRHNFTCPECGTCLVWERVEDSSPTRFQLRHEAPVPSQPQFQTQKCSFAGNVYYAPNIALTLKEG